MRKLVIFILVVTMLSMLFVGCSKPAEPAVSEPGKVAETKTDEPAAEVKPLVIANLPKYVGGAWFNRMNDGVEMFAADTKHEAFQTGADKSDAALQVKEVENLIAQGVDAINVVPVSYETLEPVLKQAMDAGIIVVSHEAAGVKNVHFDVEAFVGADYGAHLCDQMAKAMGEEGDYIITVGSLTAASHMEWANGFLAHQKAKYPNMNCINEDQFIETLYDAKASQEKAAEFMKTYPNLKGIFCTSATDITGMGLAVEEANAQGRVHLVGNGMPNANKDYVKSGAIAFLGCWDPADAGYAMGVVTEILANGGTIKTGDDLGIPGYNKVTVKENVIIGEAWINLTADVIDNYDF
ncbi:MAG: substrate-binding domain-containing protein [Tissierellaceae bacterium]|nr:substrate-binding domain-containing protein [Tissierellaceae bacterium]